ncbi:MAG: GNAT family N-acetyltransferase [Clostridia bacterium]|nr:GNAT family N-acetyltransferase [Clostridia bacterium]
MIYKENTNEAFERDCGCAIPFLMREEKGCVDYEIYDALLAFTEEFKEKYKGIEFSETALDAIWEASLDLVQQKGYQPPDKKYRTWYRRFVMREDLTIPEEKILKSTIRLNIADAEQYENLTTYDFDPDYNPEECFVTLLDKKIVSVCAINPTSEDEWCPELCVETAPAYRKRGYAASNIAAMAKALRKDGQDAEYRCSYKNIGSIAAAMAAGFEETGRIYYFVSYKNL